ncbi:RNA polymerase factor sigma-54 [Sediminibacterium roseum]|uniref:RNA polymerase factor sigma-54 n=1 Tax=Sediminibacterium roseum TaxID=1978412 RepID=A0ABW9ZVL3_9BACT|nr:RNA polymerase factor sigma-54 [Sediminibacterium roseum]NCI50535.1 RNA polymerase factor sigma-54 [Sediminibacterium roseum]
MLQQSQLQKQSLKILPQQIQMLGIYHLNTIQLEQRIKDELDENPLLELNTDDESIDAQTDKDQPKDYQDYEEYQYDDIPDYRLEAESFIHTNNLNLPIKDTIDFRTNIKQQLINLNLSEKELTIAEYIVDCIEDNGFLERSLQEIADDISFSQKMFVEESEIEKLLVQIQEFEPFGVGCRNIREFFLKQLNNQKKCPIVKKAIQLVDKYYNELQKRNFEKIYAGLGIDDEELSILFKHISSLQLKPVNGAIEGQLVKETIIPDFILTVEGETLMVDLYKQKSNLLYINQSLMQTVEKKEGRTADEKAAMQSFKNKLTSAMWFINAIKQREDNMLRIIRAIVKRQKEYFLTGDAAYMRPMILKNIADEVGLDISTISRVTCNKYIDTPFGYVLLKNLFTQSIVSEDGLSVSNRVVQIKLKAIIDAEDKDMPYNDQQLVALLEEAGIKIARRTVAKYRELLNIPVGDMRRIWAKAI